VMLFGMPEKEDFEPLDGMMHRVAVAEIFNQVGVDENRRNGQPLQRLYLVQAEDTPGYDRQADRRGEQQVQPAAISSAYFFFAKLFTVPLNGWVDRHPN